MSVFARILSNSSRARRITLFFSLLLLLPAASIAQVRVIKGEYLIRKKHSGLRAQNTQNSIELRKLPGAHARNLQGAEVVSYNKKQADSDCQAFLAEDSDIELCEPNYEIRLEALPLEYDPASSAGQALAQIDAPAGWQETSARGAGVLVAVLDTGVDRNHPDLSANMWINTAEIQNNGIDDDQNGYVDDIYGYDFGSNDPDPMDDHGHGTHVAGTVAAAANAMGVIGVAPEAKVMALKFLSSNGAGSILGAIKAIDYARQMGASVINASWGGTGLSTLLGEAIADYINAGGIFIAAAGNLGVNNDEVGHYPSNFVGVLSVAAVDYDGKLTYFSNYGQAVDVAAPGYNIYSTVPGGSYATLSGTSMAAPHVSGLAAIIKSEHPEFSSDDVLNMIVQGKVMKSIAGKSTGSNMIINVARALGAGASEPGEENPYVETVSLKQKSKSRGKSANQLQRKAAGTGDSLIADFESNQALTTFNAYIQLAEARCEIALQTDLSSKSRISFRIPRTRLAVRSVTVGTDSDTGLSARVQSTSIKRKRRRIESLSSSQLDALVERTCSRIQSSLRILNAQ